MSLIISTCDLDVEDGYPEFNMEIQHKGQLQEVIKKAEKADIPLHRLDVMYYDEESDEFEFLGNFESILEEETK